MAEIPLSIDPSKTVEPLRGIADALDDINKQADSTGDTFKQSFSKSSDAVDETTKAVTDNTKAQKKNADSVDLVKKGTVDFGKKSKSAYNDKPVDDYTKSVKQADKSTDDLAKSTDDLGDKSESVFSGLTDGLGDLGDSFGGIGEGLTSGEGGGALGGLTGILGKLGPIGLAIGAVVGGVVALGSEIIEIDKKFDDLRSTVEDLFQATGDQAARIVVNVEAIADTFDQDVNEVLLATNTLAKEFGISGEEASNLLANGFNSAANAQGDLIDSVREFSAQVRASGGDAEDLFSILEKSNQEGIFSDKGIDVVKEFGLRIREQAQGTTDALSAAFGDDFTNNLLQGVDSGAISSIDALKLVSEELGTLDENSKEVATVIADVFGGAGEDAGFRFLTQLKDINDEEGFRNRQLTEAQQRQKENLEANQRLAAAQNELSEALGDSSAVGRVWIDIQAGFFRILVVVFEAIEDLIKGFELLATEPIEGLKLIGQVILDFILIPTNLAIDALNVIPNLLGFDDIIPNISAGREALRDFTEEQERAIAVSREAQKAIQNYGKETAILVSNLEKSFAALEKGAATDERRLKVVEQLNKEYPEQTANIDLLTASEEDLLKVKQEIIKAEVERSIAEKKAFAIRQLNNEIEIRQEQLKNESISEGRRKQLEDEIKFLDENFRHQIDLVEEETKIRLGLKELEAEEILATEEELQDDLTQSGKNGNAQRLKDQQEFDKLIQQILKRGEQARLNDLSLSEEERIINQANFQRQELQNLVEHAEDLQEQLTGSRILDQEVLKAFNDADAKITFDAEQKINKIKRDARLKARQEELAEGQAILGAKQTRFDQEIALLQSQQEEEIAIIEQGQKQRFETEEGFQRRLELEKLQTQEFFLQERLDLIDREQALKINALNLELEAVADKEGAEVELIRQGLEEKKKLLEQQTSTQKEQLDLQLQNTKSGIAELESTVPTLGEVFGEVQRQIADSIGLDEQQLQAIVGAVQQVANEIFSTIQEGLSQQIEANDELINKLDEREDKVKDALDREIAFAQAGYAANVEAKREELLQIEEAQIDAAKKREELLKQQQLLDEISQISSLVTASASLYQSLAPLPFGIGIAIATALTAGMFAAFIATKSKARNVASLEKGGTGDSTGIIKGRRHSEGGEAWRDHIEVEDGEAWSVFSRKGTSKYGDLIRKFTEAVNTDNVSGFMIKEGVPNKMVKNRNQIKNDELSLQALVISNDLKSSGDVLPEIKGMLEKRFSKPDRSFIQKDGATYMVEVWPDGSKKKTKINIRG